MEFYTNVERVKNDLLYSGYKNNTKVRKVIKFQPTLYIPLYDNDKNADYKFAIDGRKVIPHKFGSISQAQNSIKESEKISNFGVYGNRNYIVQYIQEKYPSAIEFNTDIINVGFYDIEVLKGEDGYSSPSAAKNEICSISFRNNQSSKYYFWYLKEWSKEKSELPSVIRDNVEYFYFDDEKSLLTSFIKFWADPKNTPDVITGWNTELFDTPYLINRINNVLGAEFVSLLSPWRIVKEKIVRYNGREQQAYNILGISELDYINLYKKFTYVTRETYKLDHIAYVELGDSKLSYAEYSGLQGLYENNSQKFGDYNIKDVDIVYRLEDKLGLVNLAITTAYRGGVNYRDSLGTTGIWDSIIYRKLCEQDIVVSPTNPNAKKVTFDGGHVKPPQRGMFDWVVSFDLNSLYPHIIMQCNMSPETIAGHSIVGLSVDKCLKKHDITNSFDGNKYCVSANGTLYNKNHIGVIPSIISGVYDDRKRLKGLMLKAQQELVDCKGNGEREVLSKRVSLLNNQQMAAKILLNSLYGALGNPFFRYFDIRTAEGITQTGQLSIRWIEKSINDYMNKVCETNDVDYIIAIDTDSNYVNFGNLIKKLGLENESSEKVVKFIDSIVNQYFEPMIQKSFVALSEYLNSYSNKMVMEREVIANKGIWTGQKKRYVLNVLNSEGVQYSEPKLKLVGVEAIKSSTPELCRNGMKDIIKTMMTGSEETTQKAIEDFKNKFFKSPIEDVSSPRGASDLQKYQDDEHIYKKGVPIHIRGALLYNNRLQFLGLNNTYEYLKSGDKVKYCYLKLPNPIQENIIAFPDFLPQEFGLDSYIDYNLMYERTFLKPILVFIEAIGWTEKPVVNLEDLF